MKNSFKIIEILLVIFLSTFFCANGQGWQSYVDDQLVGQGFTHGAILGLDGSPWAASPQFAPKPGEGSKIANGFKSPADFFASGITFGGIKYLTIKADDRSIYGKKGAGGIVIVKTGQAIIVGVYDEKLQPGNAALIVEKLADYLIDNGY